MANDLRIQSILDVALKEFASMDFQKYHWEGFSIYCMMIACSFRTEFLKTFRREPSGWDRTKVGDWRDLQGSLTSSVILSYTAQKTIHPDITEFVKHYSGHTKVKQLESTIIDLRKELEKLKNANNELEKKVEIHSKLVEEIKGIETKMQSVTTTDHKTILNIHRDLSYLVHKETEDMKRLDTILRDAPAVASLDADLQTEISKILANIQAKLAIADLTGKTLAGYAAENKNLEVQLSTQTEESLRLKEKCERLEVEIKTLKETTSSAPAPAVGTSHSETEEKLKLFFENAIFFLTSSQWKITQRDSFETKLNELESSLEYFKTNFSTIREIKNINFFIGSLKNSQVFSAICTDYTSVFSEKELNFLVIEETFKSLSNKNKMLFKKLSGLSNVTGEIMKKEIDNYLSKRALVSSHDQKEFEFSLLYKKTQVQNLQYIPTNSNLFFADVHSSRDMVLKESKILSEYYLNMLQVCVYLVSLSSDKLRINPHFMDVLKTIPNKKSIPENYKQVLVYFFEGLNEDGLSITQGIPLTKEFIVQICSTFSWTGSKVYFDLDDGMYCANPSNFLDELKIFLESLKKGEANTDDFNLKSLALRKVE